jgi:hypothetical protein
VLVPVQFLWSRVRFRTVTLVGRFDKADEK